MEIGITLNNELVYNRAFFEKKEKADMQNIILKDSKLSKCAVFILAASNLLETNIVKASADIGGTLAKLDTAGFTFLSLAQRIAFWVCLLGCLLEILFAVFKEGRGKSAILPICMKWLGIYSAFYVLPVCFELIRDLFS